jgi:hypothetical protein
MALRNAAGMRWALPLETQATFPPHQRFIRAGPAAA